MVDWGSNSHLKWPQGGQSTGWGPIHHPREGEMSLQRKAGKTNTGAMNFVAHVKADQQGRQ